MPDVYFSTNNTAADVVDADTSSGSSGGDPAGEEEDEHKVATAAKIEGRG
jgi:hypothetical protein